jgi:hypothetical protein
MGQEAVHTVNGGFLREEGGIPWSRVEDWVELEGVRWRSTDDMHAARRGNTRARLSRGVVGE